MEKVRRKSMKLMSFSKALPFQVETVDENKTLSASYAFNFLLLILIRFLALFSKGMTHSMKILLKVEKRHGRTEKKEKYLVWVN